MTAHLRVKAQLTRCVTPAFCKLENERHDTARRPDACKARSSERARSQNRIHRDKFLIDENNFHYRKKKST